MWKALVPHEAVAPVVDKASEVFSSASPPPSTCNGEADNLVAAAFGAGASEYVEAPPTKTTRVSERGHSDPSVVTNELLSNAQTAADRGAFYSTDPHDNTTVEFWARWTLRGVKHFWGAAAVSGAGIVEETMFRALLAKPLCKLLLEHDSSGAVKIDRRLL